MKAYHFTSDKLRDGRPIPPIGEWLVHEGKIRMCESGLHASKQPFDALQYAPGSILHLVEAQGEIEHQDDKLVARKRKILASFDAEDLLWDFARQCALDVYHQWGNEKTDPKGICKRYLETGDETLRDAAIDAARAAAWDDAAIDAARAAAATTIAAAASAAARAAARAAAWAAARAAARAAASGAAARDARRKQFNKLIKAAFKKIREAAND